MSIASLPMYDLPELRDVLDAWWRGLEREFRAEGVTDVPASLDRRPGYRDVWLLPDLLISQTCGYPLTHELRGRVALLATPCYAAAGCHGAEYCSLVIVAADDPAADITDLRGRRCAINSPDSQSGANALKALIASRGGHGRFFGSVAVSGGHAAGLAMVASGDADVMAIDCVSHALLTRYRPNALVGTRVLCRTLSAPNLPYVTRVTADADLLRRLRAGLARAFAEPQLADLREAMLLAGLAELPLSDYDRIVEMEVAAARAGYAQVA